MLALRTIGAQRAASRLRRGRVRPIEGDPPATPLPLTRATLIRPRPFERRDDAAAWLERVCGEAELWGSLTSEAAAVLNRALHVHRTATGDPYAGDVDPARAVAIRFGYGSGDDVAEGRWQEARELPASERRKLRGRDLEAMRPQERIAAVLGGRERVGPHEEPILRARADLNAGRAATAALQLEAGLALLVRTMPETDPEAAARIAEAHGVAREQRRAVLDGGAADADALERALQAAESQMRRRALG